jgi:hypothetical protein
MLTKRRSLKLGKVFYCPSDYFHAMKKLEKDDPERFASELERASKVIKKDVI